MRDDSRWQLTDVQRFLIVLALATAFFLGAIALGAQSLIPALVALILIIGAAVAVFMLGSRAGARSPIQGRALVVQVPPPPAGMIIARCDMRLQVDLPGRASTTVKLRDPAAPVAKWPSIGMNLPVEISPSKGSKLRVRWELVDDLASRAHSTADDTPALSAFYTDYADGTSETQPTISYGAPAGAPSPRASYDYDEYYPSVGLEPDGLEPDGLELDPIIDAEILLPPDPTAEAKARASDFELPMRSIPQPRPAEAIGQRRIEASSAEPAAGDPDAQGMGVMLVVSDLARSLSFYRDLVGFEVIDSGANVAVLGYGGGRVLLRQLADMSPVDRRVAHLHIRVPDVDASYRDLKDRGVEFVHRPRVTSRGEKLDLWSATFRDPDGHDIALTQWRAREDAPPPGPTPT